MPELLPVPVVECCVGCFAIEVDEPEEPDFDEDPSSFITDLFLARGGGEESELVADRDAGLVSVAPVCAIMKFAVSDLK